MNLLFKEGELYIEEQIEFLHPGLERLGGKEMPKLVKHDQQGKAQQEHGSLNHNRRHICKNQVKTNKTTLLKLLKKRK